MSTAIDEAARKFDSDPNEAEASLMKLLKKNPKDVQAWLMLGTTRLRLSKHREAAEAFRDALRAEANNRPAMVLLATALEQANDLGPALGAWQAIAKAEPQSKDAREHVARLADLMGATDVALDARRELVKLLPGNPEMVADLAVYLSRAKQHGEAVRMFERANMIEPGFLEKHPTEAAEYQKSKAAGARR